MVRGGVPASTTKVGKPPTPVRPRAGGTSAAAPPATGVTRSRVHRGRPRVASGGVTALPDVLARCLVGSVDEALAATVASGTVLASGLATSEPTSVYARLWDHIRTNDVHDLEIRQALFMAPHPLLVGDALAAAGAGGTPQVRGVAGTLLGGVRELARRVPPLGLVADRLTDLQRLRLLVAHLDELEHRRIRFVSPFLGPVSSTIVPDTVLTRRLVPAWAGRNRARSPVLRYQPVHFPDAAWALAHDADTSSVDVDTYAVVTTPPATDGRLSLGASNGVDGDALELLTAAGDATVLLVVNERQPWIDGVPGLPNTVEVEQLRPLAETGRLVVVRDDAEPPALPAGSLDRPSAIEERIGALVADHISEHLAHTRGRALQVGIGGTGVQAIRRLDHGDWTGRCYTEMLDPWTWALVESGTITGSHHLDAEGRRHDLDGQVLCTFTMGQEGNGFTAALDHDPRVRMSSAARVLDPRAFAGGLGVNNILGIDFLGQVNATHRDLNPWSGIGGAAVIMRGLARGGVAYLCCTSTHRGPDGRRRSSIFPAFPQGTAVSLVGADIMGTREGARFFLVTEHGIAAINARNQEAFVRRIVSVAHPDFRDELGRAAWERYRIRL